MTKLLISGDWHANKGHAKNVFKYAQEVGASSIIQVGDFGHAFSLTQFKGTGGKIECEFTHYVAKLVKEFGIKCLWLPGNHENYEFLQNTLDDLTPQNDGTYELYPGLFYIPRGTKLEYDGVSFLCCGGAVSVDKKSRVPFVSWWKEEAITQKDIDKCAGIGKVDVLLTHDLPLEVTVIDRHLDPYWGEEAARGTYQNRVAVSEILKTSGAKLHLHGHLHFAYSQVVRVDHHPVKVIGLDRDTKPMHDNTYLLNTEQFKSTLSAWNYVPS